MRGRRIRHPEDCRQGDMFIERWRCASQDQHAVFGQRRLELGLEISVVEKRAERSGNLNGQPPAQGSQSQSGWGRHVQVTFG